MAEGGFDYDAHFGEILVDDYEDDEINLTRLKIFTMVMMLGLEQKMSLAKEFYKTIKEKYNIEPKFVDYYSKTTTELCT